MDPNATLAQLRNAISQYHQTDDVEHLKRVADLFEALDQWLAKGGFLPDNWSKS